MRVATSQYDIGYFADFTEFADKLAHWVEQASGAELVLFPEYGSMELASLFGPAVYSDLHLQIERMQSLVDDWSALHIELARQHNTHIIAASFPVQSAQGYVNRVHVFGPGGLLGFQDKCIMTRFENEQWGIKPGSSLVPISTEVGRLGIITCYDAEFPLLGHQLVDQGCDLLLAPSCTDTQAGYNRVAIGARARAMENQCYVLQSPVIGQAAWSPAVDDNVGTAAVYGPIDRGFPSDGVVAWADNDSPGWVAARLDMSALAEVRRDGQVLNSRDWHHQSRFLDT